MSSGSNNQPNSKNHELGLALPPKSKVMPLVAPKPPTVSQQQHQLLYPSNMRPTTAANNNNNNNNPFVPAQNPLLPASFAATTTTAAVGGNHPHHQNPLVATFNPVMLHMNAANGMMAAAASNNSSVTHHHSTLSSSLSSSNAPGSSNFFQGWKLRSGKWLEEEEAYAELLINMFDRGLLSDCMTGSTLRAYVAQKLHCAPMRISKKFAGKGIGKKVYSCRMENSTSNRKTIPATVVEQKRKLQEKAQEVEKTFHEAASCDAPEIQPPRALVPNFVPMITTPTGMQFAMPTMAAAQHFFPQMAQNGFMNMPNAANFFAMQHHYRQQQQQALQPSVPSVSPGTVASSTTTTAPKAVSSSMAQLQESYMKALSSQPNSVTTNSGPQGANITNTSVTKTTQTSASSHPQGAQTTSSGVCTSSEASTAGSVLPCLDPAKSTHSGGVLVEASSPGTGTQLVQVMPSSSSMAQGSNPIVSQVKSAIQVTQQLSTGHVSGSEPKAGQVATKQAGATKAVEPAAVLTNVEQPHFPDFMAGFDKVALSMKAAYATTVPTTEGQNALQCSPPMTSRSFDEFHRLLGKDLTPLDDGATEAAPMENPAVSAAKGETTKALSDKVLLDTTALFTAESYAMFAQESALAASQHAAYLAESHDKLPGGNHRMGSFDFDSTTKLVSQHVPIAQRGSTTTVPSHNPSGKSKTLFASVLPMQPSTKEKDQLEKSLTATATTGHSPRPLGGSAPVVSGSEPTSSAAESSFKGSTSESNGSDNTFSNSDDEHSESGDELHSSDDFSYDTTGGSHHKRQLGERDESFSHSQYDETSLDDFHDSPGRNRRHKRRKLSIES